MHPLRVFSLVFFLLVLSSLSCQEAGESGPDASAPEDATHDGASSELEAADAPGVDVAAPPEDHGVAWWYESTDREALRVWLPRLAEAGVTLNLALHQDDEGWRESAAIVREGAALGMATNLWPLLDYEQGYFPSVRTAALLTPFVDEILAWAEEEALPVAGLVIDLEPPVQVLVEMQAVAAGGGGPIAVVDYLRARYDPEIYAAGREELQALIARVQAAGLPVYASTLFIVLDDLQDDDDDIQRLFDAPVEALPFDEVSFQLYRTSFDDFLGGMLSASGEPLGAYVVYDYALTAVEHFGARAALDLGLVGDPGYDAPGELAADAAASLAAGLSLSALNVYSLMALMEMDDPEPWLDLSSVTAEAPPEDSRVHTIRAVLQGMDGGETL
jgi:hypothetical protein